MENPVVIDRSTYKFMRYVYFRSDVSIDKLYNKFDRRRKPRDIVLPCIITLCSSQFGAYRRPDHSITFDFSFIEPSGRFGLTPLGNQYVENRMSSSFKWVMTTFISLFAIFISLLSLVASFHNDIFVHIVK